MFQGRKLLIATKHKKEQAIAPVLEKELGVRCFTSSLDTDRLGTFTGETERIHDPFTTARLKCTMAMDEESCDLCIASEGSFGSHPTVPFIPANEEILVLIDRKHELEISARELTTETNFNAMDLCSGIDLAAFAKRALFPSHALIIRKSASDATQITKGITDNDELHEVFSKYIALYGSARVETDMRAMFNPTRMKVIERVAWKLSDKIKSLCPSCGTPGFGITSARTGLPCSSCFAPTRSTLSHIYSCSKCGHFSEVRFPYKKEAEDPMYCDVCNP